MGVSNWGQAWPKQPLELTANNSKLSGIAMDTKHSSRRTVKVASVLTKGR